MSLITYNSIILQFPLTTDFSFENVYDESNTDRMYRKLDMTVQAVINTDYKDTALSGIPAGQGDTAVAMMKYMVGKLEVPRKSLSIKFNGVELIPDDDVTPPDAKNGPLPQTVKATLLTNTTFLITFRIVAHYAAEDAAIVSNRWTETITIDQHNYTTRRREGRFVIRSNNKEKKQADDFRVQNCITAVPIGFIRESSEYRISQDGLTLNFTLTDKEVFLKPPKGAFSAEGTYTETTAMNSMRMGEVTVTLRGGNQSTHAELIKQVVLICVTKAIGRGALDAKTRKFARIENFTVRQSLYDNKVTASLRCLINTKGAGGSYTARVNGIAAIDWGEFTNPPAGSDPTDIPSKHLSRGTAFILGADSPGQIGVLRAAAYFDPGAGAELARATGLLDGGTQPGSAG